MKRFVVTFAEAGWRGLSSVLVEVPRKDFWWPHFLEITAVSQHGCLRRLFSESVEF
jgi:hypothetical protein